MPRDDRRRSREREPSPGRHQRRCHSRGRQPPPSQLPRERNQVHESVQAMTPLASPGRLDCWPGSPLTGKTSGNAESRVSLSVTELSEAIARGMSRATGKSLPETLERQVIRFTVEAAGIKSPSELAKHFRGAECDAQKLLKNFVDLKRDARPVQSSRTASQRHYSNSNYKRSNNPSTTTLAQVQCHNCGEYGHVKKFCPNTSKTPKLPALEYRHVNFVSSESKGSAKFLKNIDVNNTQSTKCFVDLGSECSLITIDKAKTLNLPITPRVPNVYLTTIGTEIIPVTHSTWADFTLDNITKHIELLLVTECVRDVEILIGQNFTELADIEYYKCGDKLKLVQTRCLNSVKCLENKNYQVEVGTTEVVKRGRSWLTKVLENVKCM
jgi:hypothetical protein